MFHLLYKHQWNTKFKSFKFRCERRDLSCNHSNGDLFNAEDNMLFSLVNVYKGSCEILRRISLVFI